MLLSIRISKREKTIFFVNSQSCTSSILLNILLIYIINKLYDKSALNYTPTETGLFFMMKPENRIPLPTTTKTGGCGQLI